MKNSYSLKIKITAAATACGIAALALFSGCSMSLKDMGMTDEQAEELFKTSAQNTAEAMNIPDTGIGELAEKLKTESTYSMTLNLNTGKITVEDRNNAENHETSYIYSAGGTNFDLNIYDAEGGDIISSSKLGFKTAYVPSSYRAQFAAGFASSLLTGIGGGTSSYSEEITSAIAEFVDRLAGDSESGFNFSEYVQKAVENLNIPTKEDIAETANEINKDYFGGDPEWECVTSTMTVGENTLKTAEFTLKIDGDDLKSALTIIKNNMGLSLLDPEKIESADITAVFTVLRDSKVITSAKITGSVATDVKSDIDAEFSTDAAEQAAIAEKDAIPEITYVEGKIQTVPSDGSSESSGSTTEFTLDGTEIRVKQTEDGSTAEYNYDTSDDSFSLEGKADSVEFTAAGTFASDANALSLDITSGRITSGSASAGLTGKVSAAASADITVPSYQLTVDSDESMSAFTSSINKISLLLLTACVTADLAPILSLFGES